MPENRYLKWLANETCTSWWHDSADPDELKAGLSNGACGVTTNPLLAAKSLHSRPDVWREIIAGISKELKGPEKAEAILERITKTIASMLSPVYERTKGKQGYVCAQVNPEKPGDVKAMRSMAKRFSGWAPNIAVKLPSTAAGLEALEECSAQGMTVTVTASFTVPQVIATAERYRKGLEKAHRAGISPGKCFAVIMVGRLDDYLRDVAMDRKADVTESDVTQAGIAVTKRAHSLFKERGYEATLLVAAMRGPYHAVELAGAEMVFSIHPSIQAMLMQVAAPGAERIGTPVREDVLGRLATIPEFVRAYEPDGMKPEEFITFGLTQKTLSQFVESGWKPLEAYKL